MRGSLFVVAPLLVLAVGACGGSSSTPTKGQSSSGSAFDGYCKAELAWRDRCGSATCPSGAIACAPGTTCTPPPPKPCDVSGLPCETNGGVCLERIFRPEALAQMKECEDQLACNGGKEHCVENVALPTPLPSAVAFASACQARTQACQGQVGDQQFFCFDLSAMTDEYIALYRACLDQPCSSIRSCEDGGKFAAFCAG